MSLELNRRDLLRFFGIGATIVPVIGGAAKLDSPARLIEEAKVEPAERFSPEMDAESLLTSLFIQRQIFQVTVEGPFFGHANGRDEPRRGRFYARSFLVEMQQDLIDIDSRSGYREFVPGLRSGEWSLKGCMMPETRLPNSPLYVFK